MSRLTTDLFDLTELAHHGPEDLLTSAITVVGALTVMATIQWRLALLVGIMIPILLAVMFSLRRRMARVSAEVKKKTGHINTEIESSLSGIRTAKAFANEDIECARFRAANEVYKTSKREFHKAMGMFLSSWSFPVCAECGGHRLRRLSHNEGTAGLQGFLSPFPFILPHSFCPCVRYPIFRNCLQTALRGLTVLWI